LTFRDRHLGFSTSGCLLTTEYYHNTTRKISVVESMGVAVGILFPTSVDLKIFYILYAVHKLSLLLPVLNRHIFHLVGDRLLYFHHLVALSYLGKATKAFSHSPIEVTEWERKQWPWRTFTPATVNTKVIEIVTEIAERNRNS